MSALKLSVNHLLWCYWARGICLVCFAWAQRTACGFFLHVAYLGFGFAHGVVVFSL